MLQPLVFGPQLMLNNNHIPEAAFLYPRNHFIVWAWPERTWLITVSYVNTTPHPSPSCRREPTSPEPQVQAQVYSVPSFLTSAEKGDCHWAMTPERGNGSSGSGGGGTAMGCVLMESSLQRCTAINTGRTLGVLALTTNSWTTPHSPKEQLYTFVTRAEYRILLIRNSLT